MNRSKIQWPWKPLYTWNPVIGCRSKKCPYCYAKRLNDRFKFIPKWEEPQFINSRMEDPSKVRRPRNIFVGSMCDLFGDWVPDKWINAVIFEAKMNPQHTFIFLTKNPKRYKEFDFPQNCWLGATLTGEDSGKDWPANLKNDPTVDLYRSPNRTFISVEPLLGPFYGHLFLCVDLIIVGAQTGPGAKPPKREWIDSIKHNNIYYKNNILKHFPDLEIK